MTDDLISRQAAIDTVSDLYWMDERLLNFKKEIDATFDKIKSLPSANVPIRKVGKWIERKVIEDGKAIEEWQSARCSVCGKYHTTPYMYYFDDFAYCPNCGAEMRKETR